MSFLYMFQKFCQNVSVIASATASRTVELERGRQKMDRGMIAPLMTISVSLYYIITIVRMK